MTSSHTNPLAITALALASANAATPAPSTPVNTLIAGIRDKDDKRRGLACQNASSSGPDAIQPLSDLLADPDVEVARAAKRALWRIVRHAGRPGAGKERNGVVARLIPLLASSVHAVRRETLWMLSEIGGNEAVSPMAALLSDPALREDARITLHRISGPKVIAALNKALGSASADFKPNIAQSLRALGEKVEGWPSQSLVPCKATGVKALPAP